MKWSLIVKKKVLNHQKLVKGDPKWLKTAPQGWLVEKTLLNSIVSIRYLPIQGELLNSITEKMRLFYSLPEMSGRPKIFSPGLLMTNCKSYKKKSKIQNLEHWKLYENTFPVVNSLCVNFIETLETLEFKSPIFEFKCFKAPQLYD